MFSAADVDALLQQTTKTLDRALALVEEKGASTGACGRPTAAAAECALPPPVGDNQRSAGLHELEALSCFESYVEAAGGIAGRLRSEMDEPSAAVRRQRRRGQLFPLVRRVTDGLRAQSLWAGSPECQRLWWPHGDDGASADITRGRWCGASLSAALLLAACGADAVHQSAPAAASHRAAAASSYAPESVAAWLGGGRGILEWAEGGLLPDPVARSLLSHTVAMLSAPIPLGDDETEDSVASESGSEQARASAPAVALPTGLCLYPPLLESVTVGGGAALGAAVLVGPSVRAARQLPALFLNASAERFHTCAARLSRLLCAVATAVGWTPRQPQRARAFLREYLGAVVSAVEDGFTPETARPGATAAVNAALAGPLRPCVAALAAGGGDDGSVSTALYRLLLVVESLGRAELALLSGEGHSVLRQRRYAELLRQAHDKVTLPLLAAVAEDRQLLVEPTDMRAPTGEKLHRLSAMPEQGGVLLYVSDGLIYYKKPARREFKKAKGVEEVFSLLA